MLSRPESSVMAAPTTEDIAAQIATMSGRPVLLEQDLARIYGVTVRRLRGLVQRHPRFFPGEFCFTAESSELYREGLPPVPDREAFTCAGALMAAALLHRPDQLARSVQVAAAFESVARVKHRTDHWIGPSALNDGRSRSWADGPGIRTPGAQG